MHTGKTTPQMCWSTGNTDDVPSLTWTVVVPALLRTNRHTPLRHTRGCSTEHLLVVWGVTQPGMGAWSWDLSVSRLGHLTTTATTVTVWMNIWGVTQPGTGTWSWDQSLSWLGHLTNCITERNNNEYLRCDPAWNGNMRQHAPTCAPA